MEKKIYFKYLQKQLEENKSFRLFFWGDSLFLREFLSENKPDTYKIEGIIDNDIRKAGREIYGYKIYSPLVLEKSENIKIVFAIKNNHTFIYSSVKNFIDSFKNSNIELLPNIFDLAKNEITFEKYTSNKLFLVNEFGEKRQITHIDNLEIEWTGENGIIEIGANPIPKFINGKIRCGSNSKIKIGSTRFPLVNFDVIASAPNSYLEIGKDFSCMGVQIIIHLEPDMKVIIGEDCMFSNGIYIRNTDGHTIIDMDTNEVINRPGDIVIGKHVWMCNNSRILKNAKIPDNTIVGNSALVNKSFDEENTVLAGVPAKIVKRNVKWDRNPICKYNDRK